VEVMYKMFSLQLNIGWFVNSIIIMMHHEKVRKGGNAPLTLVVPLPLPVYSFVLDS